MNKTESVEEFLKYPLSRSHQRALDVFLRNSYRTHTSLSSLADRKSNILIRFNSILISILLIFFKEILALNPAIFISGITFLITSLISLAFATLAARPHVTEVNSASTDQQELKKNLFFFGNFVKADLQKYENAFDEMIKDKELIYGNMIRDIYYLGKVLEIKFKYIRWSYNTFLTGLTLTVLSFLLSFFWVSTSG